MPSNWSTSKGNFWGYGDPLPTYTGENIAIFMGGTNAYSSSINNTSIYSYSTNTSLSGATLSVNASNGSAISNGTNAVFCNGRMDGNSITETDIYTYSNNVVTSGGLLTYTSSYTSAIGNNSLGIFVGGNNNNSSLTSIYEFSTNTAVTGALSTYHFYGSAAIGNATIGVFCGGNYGNPITGSRYIVGNSSVYLYQNNVFMDCASIQANVVFPDGASNPYVGIVAGGLFSGGPCNYTTSLYTFNTMSVSTGGNLSVCISLGGSASNGSVGVFGNLGSTSLYTFSNNSFTAGGNLSYTVWDTTATGPNPGINYGTIIYSTPSTTSTLFTSNGNYVVPNGVFSISTIYAFGGGGGGGGSFNGDYPTTGSNGVPGGNSSVTNTATNNVAIIADGGAGGNINYQPTPGQNGGIASINSYPVIPGTVLSIVVGNGGNGGTSIYGAPGVGGANDSNGTPSSKGVPGGIAANAVTLTPATGGQCSSCSTAGHNDACGSSGAGGGGGCVLINT